MKYNNTITLIGFLFVLAFFSCKDNDDDGGDGGVNTVATKMTISSITKFEGDANTTFDFKVRLNQRHSDPVTVDFSTKELAAKEGLDFESQSGTLTFDDTTEEIISIVILTDTLKEPDEDFEVNLSNATVGFDNSTAIGTIRNDDDFVVLNDDGYITPDAYAGMTLTWRDEFDGNEINLDNWTHEIGTGSGGWGNNEKQYYTDSHQNSYVANGVLTIEAKEQNINGSDYSSARMISAGKQEYIFGRIDIRAKLPEGQGIWPAIWMLGSNFWTSGWPSCGEIDIMELVGHQPSTVHGTAHYGQQGQPSMHHGNGYGLVDGKFSDEFHVFSLIWQNNSIKWYVDDNEFFTLNDSNVNGIYPFNQEFFFIMNIAVGGNWPGSPDATTIFPQKMEVDYIRVFQ